jgi:hypothetical protein
VVEVAQIIVHETDEPNLLADLLDAEELARFQRAQLTPLATLSASRSDDRLAPIAAGPGYAAVLESGRMIEGRLWPTRAKT